MPRIKGIVTTFDIIKICISNYISHMPRIKGIVTRLLLTRNARNQDITHAPHQGDCDYHKRPKSCLLSISHMPRIKGIVTSPM